MDSVMKGLIGAMPPPSQNFWARTSSAAVLGLDFQINIDKNNKSHNSLNIFII